MIVYKGSRGLDGVVVEVCRLSSNGEVLERSPLKHVVRHSPTGFEWGYGGSGPADLSLSLLTHAVGPEVAERLYQKFKWEVVARFPFDEWSLPRKAVREYVRRLEERAAEI